MIPSEALIIGDGITTVMLVGTSKVLIAIMMDVVMEDITKKEQEY